jgi:uncharacterized membrane protein YfcA
VSAPEAIAILLAGVAAGAINAVVGSGTLITFPVLLWAGYPPLVANVSNTIGLVPGSVSGAIGYRRELTGQRGRAWHLGRASLLGGITGAGALLLLPESSFDAIVPVFVALALVLVVAQPRLARALAARRQRQHPHGGAGALAGVYGAGVYGGYFGAAQGILLLAVMGVTLDEDLHRINALKNVLAAIVNGVAGLIFALAAPVSWGPVALIAAGSIAGGQLGGRYGRRLPPAALRALIVVVGLAAIVQLVAR